MEDATIPKSIPTPRLSVAQPVNGALGVTEGNIVKIQLASEIQCVPDVGLSVVWNNWGFGKPHNEFEISREGDGDYRLWFCINPDYVTWKLACGLEAMTGEKQFDWIEGLERLGANTLIMEFCFSRIWTSICFPIEAFCTEEGVMFALDRVEYSSVEVYKAPASVAAIVRAMIRSERFRIILSKAADKSPEEWLRSGIRGEQKELAEFTFDNTSVLREEFANVFGENELAAIATDGNSNRLRAWGSNIDFSALDGSPVN